MLGLEIEVGNDRNVDLYFRPLQRRLRGRFDLLRCNEPQAKAAASEWPGEIPGQRIGVDPDGNCYVQEPLQSDEALKQKIAKAGYKLEPSIQDYKSAHVPTWLFWMRRAVESGAARVVSGKLPKEIDGEPQKSWVLKERKPDTDRLAAAIEKQTAVFQALIEALQK